MAGPAKRRLGTQTSVIFFKMYFFQSFSSFKVYLMENLFKGWLWQREGWVHRLLYLFKVYFWNVFLENLFKGWLWQREGWVHRRDILAEWREGDPSSTKSGENTFKIRIRFNELMKSQLTKKFVFRKYSWLGFISWYFWVENPSKVIGQTSVKEH